MRKHWLFLFGLILFTAGLGGYFWGQNPGNLLQKLGLARKDVVYGPNTPNITNLIEKDLESCQKIDINDASASGKLMQQMMNYLEDKESVSADNSFIGTWVQGTKCFRLRISDLELYATEDNYLVILKNGKEYRRIPPEIWIR